MTYFCFIQALEEERKKEIAKAAGSQIKSKVRLTWEEAAVTAAVTDEKVISLLTAVTYEKVI